MDKVRNELIRENTHTGRLRDNVRECILRWFGYVQRSDEEYIAKENTEYDIT